MKIDAFPHIVPPKLMERVRRLAPRSYPPSQGGIGPSLWARVAELGRPIWEHDARRPLRLS